MLLHLKQSFLQWGNLQKWAHTGDATSVWTIPHLSCLLEETLNWGPASVWPSCWWQVKPKLTHLFSKCGLRLEGYFIRNIPTYSSHFPEMGLDWWCPFTWNSLTMNLSRSGLSLGMLLHIKTVLFKVESAFQKWAQTWYATSHETILQTASCVIFPEVGSDLVWGSNHDVSSLNIVLQ